jgi:hypothetical protein
LTNADISDLFDGWDAERGDLCRNTGYRNVRGDVREGQAVVVADCRRHRNSKNTASSKSNGRAANDDYTKVDRSNAKVRETISQGRFERGFLDAVEDMCARNDMNAMGLLSVTDFETVGTFRPDIRNPRGSATGLIQFLSPTARALGTIVNALSHMGQVQQLSYVEAYFQMQKRNHRRAECRS